MIIKDKERESHTESYKGRKVERERVDCFDQDEDDDEDNDSSMRKVHHKKKNRNKNRNKKEDSRDKLIIHSKVMRDAVNRFGH